MPIEIRHSINPLILGMNALTTGYLQARRGAQAEENRANFQNDLYEAQGYGGAIGQVAGGAVAGIGGRLWGAGGPLAGPDALPPGQVTASLYRGQVPYVQAGGSPGAGSLGNYSPKMLQEYGQRVYESNPEAAARLPGFNKEDPVSLQELGRIAIGSGRRMAENDDKLDFYQQKYGMQYGGQAQLAQAKHAMERQSAWEDHVNKNTEVTYLPRQIAEHQALQAEIDNAYGNAELSTGNGMLTPEGQTYVRGLQERMRAIEMSPSRQLKKPSPPTVAEMAASGQMGVFVDPATGRRSNMVVWQGPKGPEAREVTFEPDPRQRPRSWEEAQTRGDVILSPDRRTALVYDETGNLSKIHNLPGKQERRGLNYAVAAKIVSDERASQANSLTMEQIERGESPDPERVREAARQTIEIVNDLMDRWDADDQDQVVAPGVMVDRSVGGPMPGGPMPGGPMPGGPMPGGMGPGGGGPPMPMGGGGPMPGGPMPTPGGMPGPMAGPGGPGGPAGPMPGAVPQPGGPMSLGPAPMAPAGGRAPGRNSQPAATGSKAPKARREAAVMQLAAYERQYGPNFLATLPEHWRKDMKAEIQQQVRDAGYDPRELEALHELRNLNEQMQAKWRAGQLTTDDKVQYDALRRRIRAEFPDMVKEK